MPHGHLVARDRVEDASPPLARDASAPTGGPTFASTLLARVMIGSILLLAMLVATNLLMLRWLD